MIREAKAVESAISDPPKPRLRTSLPGKSWAMVFQSLKEELPMNRIPSRGGGLVRSLASKAWISGSQRDEFVLACPCSFAKPETRTTSHSQVLRGDLNMKRACSHSPMKARLTTERVLRRTLLALRGHSRALKLRTGESACRCVR